MVNKCCRILSQNTISTVLGQTARWKGVIGPIQGSINISAHSLAHIFRGTKPENALCWNLQMFVGQVRTMMLYEPSGHNTTKRQLLFVATTTLIS